MKKVVLLCCFFPLLFAACKKNKPIPLKVTYHVEESTVATPTFSISYTSDQSGGTTIASSASATWNSSSIELEPGQFVSMKVDCTEPQYDLLLRIYVNGFVFKEGHLQQPTSSITLSGNIAQQ